MIEENKRKNKESYDLTANDIDISIGDIVLLKTDLSVMGVRVGVANYFWINR